MPRGKDIAWIALTLAGVLLAIWWQASRVRPFPAEGDMTRAATVIPGSATPSVDSPKYESVQSADLYLKDDGEGLALEIGGKRRFYPFQVLVWHGAVNDELSGVPVLVSYAPLAGSAGAFDRRVDGAALSFDATNELRNGAPTLLDRETRSVGTGRLGRLSAIVTTWRAWREAHPDSSVLARPESFDRDYTRDPYAEYRAGAAVWYPVDPKDARLPAKERVHGLMLGGEAKAYRAQDMARQLIVQDTVGGAPVLLMYDRELSAARAFDRRLGEEAISFLLDDDRGVLDEQGRSEWDATGLARRGPLKGTRLREIPLEGAYWSYWAATNPGTGLWTP